MDVLTVENISSIRPGDRLEFASGGRDKVIVRNGKLCAFGLPLEQVFNRIPDEIIYIDRCASQDAYFWNILVKND